MTDDEATCQHLKVLDERITRERELREALEAKLDERDRRYEDRFKAQEMAVNAALQAQEKLTASAFNASEKAITKAETSQTQYNATHNDLTRKMDAQYKEMLPRIEAETRFKGIDEKIGDLRESRSSVEGVDKNKAATWVAVMALIGLAIAVAALILKK